VTEAAEGALDLSECPGLSQPPRKWARKRGCKCGVCAVCGFPKHCALHGPLYGQPPGSKPYAHAYQAGGKEKLA